MKKNRFKAKRHPDPKGQTNPCHSVTPRQQRPCRRRRRRNINSSQSEKRREKNSRQPWLNVCVCACVCLFSTSAWRLQHTRSWFWAPLIVKAHYQSLSDSSGPEQRLPALRIIWALDTKLLLWHTQKARDSVKENFCPTLGASAVTECLLGFAPRKCLSPVRKRHAAVSASFSQRVFLLWVHPGFWGLI